MNWLSSALHLGTKRTLCPGEGNMQLFVNESQESLVDFAGENALRVDVRQPFDHEGDFLASAVLIATDQEY